MLGMNIDEDLVSRFIRNEDMVFIVRIFKSELGELECILGNEPDCSYLFSKLLHVWSIEFIRVGLSN